MPHSRNTLPVKFPRIEDKKSNQIAILGRYCFINLSLIFHKLCIINLYDYANKGVINVTF